jgi:RHH-type proline utilization regulon transcriptional repressor/proline dehydrogenase/delta 1-pyrroline-5-carboxylate dehydrogenase
MLKSEQILAPTGLRQCMNDAYRMPEKESVIGLMAHAQLDERQLEAVRNRATSLIEAVRLGQEKSSGMDLFLTAYSLSSEEGITLMCLAEALLRIPDPKNRDKLIKDKLTRVSWQSQAVKNDSVLVNVTTWALMVTGKILSPELAISSMSRYLMNFVNRSSEGVIRRAANTAMRIMSKHFVIGRTIEEALRRSKKQEALGYRYSYDMLGEAALTARDARHYYDAYKSAIEAMGAAPQTEGSVYQKSGISIKLSALHPRYFEAQHDRVLTELVPQLLTLAQLAKRFDIALTIDAEESERLDLSLDVMEAVFNDDSLAGWNGLGLAVQAYQKRAFYVLDWVASLARSQQRRIMVRLVKGAYWDSEIKKTQMQGLSDYPVFTRKVFTDVSYQACAKKMLTLTDAIYPQFATHNAYSVALILELAGDYRDFEFQCLYGMGKELYHQIVPAARAGIPCRIYAPVGSHEALLPYLVRRLLENGANSSFVNRVVDQGTPITDLVKDPVAQSGDVLAQMNRSIPLPRDIFPHRINSSGIDWSDRAEMALLQERLRAEPTSAWVAEPRLSGRKSDSKQTRTVYSPQAHHRSMGTVTEASEADCEWALSQASLAFPAWENTPVAERAECLRRLADLMETHQATLLAMACIEAGKTALDGLAEIREAVDFCRYYAAQAVQLMSEPTYLQGYTGELNELTLHPRGVVLCISPWNFPLAIFIGQVVASLVTGNCVIAKPAEQTSIMACFAADLIIQAGVPAGVMQVLPGRGETIGAALVADRRIQAVIFTGSTQTAALIHQALATRGGAIIPLIAETGGQNTMIVDSSALLEQVVVDVVASAFGSAGQRCSALRVLYVQEDVYPRAVELLQGAMAELIVGDPQWLVTDVGPVIDEDALAGLKRHVKHMKKNHTLLHECTLSSSCEGGYFIAPTAFEIDHINQLDNEVFGPVLHVIPFNHEALDDVIQQINSTQYGLTLGIHSRINQTVEYIRKRVHAGNCYVNRNMIGAVVGLQPFGGEGLSGTGPKAGGPNYLQRLCHERTYTVDTTAAGGNASLMASEL